MRGLIVAAGLLAVVAAPAATSGQQVAPRNEDAVQPPPGDVRLGAGPLFQSWHREFGPDGSELPVSRRFEGPLLERVSPGAGAVVDRVNADADALGFAPLSGDEAALGDLVVRDVTAEIRSVALTLEAGLVERLSVDLMVPLVRTEVEPTMALDPAGATLGGAALALGEPGALFGSMNDARSQLASRLEAGDVPPDREDEALALLDASGAFAEALQQRFAQNALLPLSGTRAGSEIEAFYGELRSGFRSFGLAIPDLQLAADGDAAFLDDFFLGTLVAETPGTTVRGWLAGEAEFGLRFALLRKWEPSGDGLRLRTTIGARARLPFRDPNAQPFVDPSRLLGFPLGDGQRDVEVSLYQDVAVGEWLVVKSTARYGLQLADELTMAVRSPDRPLALPEQRVEVERDLGDYLRARVSPRARLNPALSVGLEYRFWHKRGDSYRALGPDVNASVLELRTEQTRHRAGVGATYRPVPPDEGEPAGAVPELGVVYQTPVAGSGGVTPAAGLATFHVRVPLTVF